MKEVKEEIKGKEKDKKNKVWLYILIVLIIIIIIFLIWWFNRKFDVTFKYNNGSKDYEVKVKYLRKIKKEDIKKDLVYNEHTFIDYYETYLLDKNDKTCRKGFKLEKELNKCVSKSPYDFDTKINKNTIIEALWSSILFSIDPTSKSILVGDEFNIVATVSGTDDKTVKWSSENNDVATVDDNGHVVGKKAGTVNIIVESNGIRKVCIVRVDTVTTTTTTTTKGTTTTTTKQNDDGKVSLSSSKQCMIGTDSIKFTASVSDNALNKNVAWKIPDCYKWTDDSDYVKTVSRHLGRNSCSDSEASSASVVVNLANGQSATTSFMYEPVLSYTVYNSSSTVQPENSYYNGNDMKIVTNVPAEFSGNYIDSTTSNSVKIKKTSQTVITIRTKCGQSATINIMPIIN